MCLISTFLQKSLPWHSMAITSPAILSTQKRNSLIKACRFMRTLLASLKRKEFAYLVNYGYAWEGKVHYTSVFNAVSCQVSFVIWRIMSRRKKNVKFMYRTFFFLHNFYLKWYFKSKYMFLFEIITVNTKLRYQFF